MGNTPFTLKCPRCVRANPSWRESSGRVGRGQPTGNTGRLVRRNTLYRYGKVRQREMECEVCGHTWMTTHPDVCPDHPQAS